MYISVLKSSLAASSPEEAKSEPKQKIHFRFSDACTMSEEERKAFLKTYFG
jgi:hypothetical protein